MSLWRHLVGFLCPKNSSHEAPRILYFLATPVSPNTRFLLSSRYNDACPSLASSGLQGPLSLDGFLSLFEALPVAEAHVPSAGAVALLHAHGLQGLAVGVLSAFRRPLAFVAVWGLARLVPKATGVDLAVAAFAVQQFEGLFLLYR